MGGCLIKEVSYMELLYLFVSRYQGLKKFEINFSPEFKISYSVDKKIISCERSNTWVEDFWEPLNIKNVRGIIGRNGSGKTTLMRLILQSSILKDLPRKTENIIVVYRDQINSKRIKCYHHKTIIVEEMPDYFDLIISPRLYKNTLIFHSNHFDPFSNPMDLTKSELPGMINLSTNFLLLKDKETYLSRDPNSSKMGYSQTLALHKTMELRRQVNFIRKYKDDTTLSHIQIPNYLRISPNKTEEEWILSEPNFIKDYAHSLVSTFEKFTRNASSGNELLSTFFKSSIYNLLNHIRVNEKNNQSVGSIIAFIVSAMQSFDDFDENDISSMYKALSTKYSSMYFIKKTHSDLIALFSLLKDAKISSLKDCFFFDLKKRSITEFNKFFDNYFSENRITSFIDLELSHDQNIQTTPSSGELAMLNFFSRFASIRKTEIKSDLLILLDEVELALHPEWQRNFLKSILPFFSREFGPKRTIQLVISSHSPFVVSDLPRECLSFIDEKQSKIGQTFGANINKLFADAFFLKTSFMGEFAKSKIEDLIQYLKEEKVENLESANMQRYWTEFKAQKMINLIGDDLIRRRLQDLYCVKFHVEKESLLDKKKRLLNDIKEINHQLGLSND